MIETRLLEGPLPDEAPRASRPDAGAEIVFYGRVRDEENGRRIVALDYEHYPEMTEAELGALAEEAVRRYPLLDLHCLHRVGRVPVGEAAVRISVRSVHRGEALAALDWFIRELKQRVPLWKWGVTAEGERFPSSSAEPAGNERPGARGRG